MLLIMVYCDLIVIHMETSPNQCWLRHDVEISSIFLPIRPKFNVKS